MIYKEPQESPEQLSDQSALPNLNATWVNAKGTSTERASDAGSGGDGGREREIDRKRES